MKFSSPAAALGGLDFDEIATVFEFGLPRALVFDVLPDRRTHNKRFSCRLPADIRLAISSGTQ